METHGFSTSLCFSGVSALSRLAGSGANGPKTIVHCRQETGVVNLRQERNYHAENRTPSSERANHR